MSGPSYPLKASTNGRYLVDQTGKPVFLNGEDAYSLAVQLRTADVQFYLDDRRGRGINAIWVTLIDTKFCDNAPSNIYGNAPFTGTVFTTPNEAYFAQVDTVINEAAKRGICVFLSPLYLGYQPEPSPPEGWYDQVNAASTSDMTSWGNYVGNRYASFPNIVWIIGGDTDPTPLASKVEAFVSALLAKDANHLVTAHNAGNNQTAAAPWDALSQTFITLNSTYETDSPGIYQQPASAYTRTPTIPLFGIESNYEHEHSTTAQQLRAQLYWTVLSGGVGQFIGVNPIWGFSTATAVSFADGSQTAGGWKNNLNSTGVQHRRFANALFTAMPWHTLVPDSGHTVATAGYGTNGQTNYVTTAASEDGTLLVAYLPAVSGLTIAMSKMAAPCSAYWFDPTSCSFTTISGGPFSNSGSHTFTPSGNNAAGDTDWILVLKPKNQAAVVTMSESAVVTTS